MTQYGFYFDLTRCTGCRTCAMACRDYKDLDASVAFRRVYDYEGGSWVTNADGTCAAQGCFAYHVSISCQHCSDPACVGVCPTHAMRKDAETGIVSVDASRCIGCGYCHMACPYDAPTVDRAAGHSVKCDGCVDRVTAGKRPICVEACPLRALEFDDIEKLRAEHGDAADVAPLPAPSYTNPNLTIKTTDVAVASAEATGFVANPLEVM